MAKNREVGIRLSIKDKDVVERALVSLGKDGEAALKRIGNAAKPASTSLLALNAATSTVRTGVSGMLSGWAAGLAPILTVTAAINGTRAALEKFGEIADRSKSAGVDAEFFQGVAYQAKLAGVDIGTLSGALDTFNKNSGQAVEGRGRMVQALKVENAELLRNLQLATSQEERLRLVANALRDTSDANKKAALAAAAFGDAGTDLVAVFEGGAASIDATIAKARELGIVVERETIERADELGDKFDTVSQIIDTKLKASLVNLGPTLVWLLGLANSFIDVLDNAFQAGKPLADQSTKALKAELESLQTIADKARNGGVISQMYAEKSDVSGRKAAIEKELFRRADSKSVDLLALATPPASTPLSDLPLTDEAKAAVKAAEALIKRLRTESETYADTVGELKSLLDAGLISQETFNRGAAEAALKFAKAADDSDEYSAALARIEEAHRHGLITELQYTDAVESLVKRRLIAQNDWVAGVQLGLKQIKEGANSITNDVAGAVTGWANSLGEQIATAAQTGKFAWQDLVKSILADTAKLATQQLITRPLAGLLGSVFGGILGGGLNPAPVTNIGFGSYGSFDVGGWTGGRAGQPAGMVHGEEFVVKAGPAARHRDMLEAINRGQAVGPASLTLAPVYQINGSGLSQGQLLAVLEQNNDALMSRVSDVVKADIGKGRFG